MKKLIAIVLACLSALYFAVGIVIPDPVPFIDEGLALVVFLNTTAYLGLDFKKFFSPSKKKKNEIDV